MNKNPILLAILDGFGIAEKSKTNAVTVADMKNIEKLKKEYPWVEAHASGKWVGLSEGQMGNSEVGHTHIGSGKIVMQPLSIINNALEDKTFYKNKEINNAINFAKKNSSSLHVMGMLSDGGVHSHMNHLIGVLEIASKNNFKNTYIHIIADGRDTKPRAVDKYIKILQQNIKKIGIGKIASISGRYYSMDRDQRWDRLEKAYDAIVNKKGDNFDDVLKYVEKQYSDKITDEFIVPAYNNTFKEGNIIDGDAIIFTNFRPDRAIQIASAFTNPKYLWTPKKSLKNIYFVSMMKYADSVKSDKYAFSNNKIEKPLGKIIEENGLSQLRVAETEKIAHVTYFFDGGKDVTYKNSKRLLIPSPKVATYDLKPEMAAHEITNGLIKEIEKNIHDVIILNFANADMVGHTGNLNATIKGLKVLDECIGKIYETIKKHDGTLIITADHGNAEVMVEDNIPNKKHTTNKVPIIITNKNLTLRKKDAAIVDIAPTIIDLLNIKIPKEMDRKSLIEKKK